MPTAAVAVAVMMAMVVTGLAATVLVGHGAGGGDGAGAGSGDSGVGGGWWDAAPLQAVDDAHAAAALEIARCAAPLHALAPPSTWPEEQTRAWVAALAALTLRIGPVLQATDREKTDLVLDFLRLPATVLVPFLGAAAERSPQLKDFLARLTDEGNPLAAEEEPGPILCEREAV